MVIWMVFVVIVALLLALAAFDLIQKRHAILRNFPVIGHLRYVIEAFGPELRQYIVTGNEDEQPFNRNERRWIYSTAEEGNTYYGFGTDVSIDTISHHLIIKNAAFPKDAPTRPVELPAAKVLGRARGRAKALRPPSVVNISAMSFGSLSGAAVEALNWGAGMAGCWQTTGEGGLAPQHLRGGDLVFQLGSGYFGCRNRDGSFDLAKLVALAEQHPVRAIEIKLSQGAKPGVGGVLPATKVTPEIALMRGVEAGKDCISPTHHSAFGDVSSMLDFVEEIAWATGLPVGIKSAVGELGFFEELAAIMANEERGVDFITVDGGEGGTGAGPLVFVDHVALPFKVGFSRVYRVFAEAGICDDVVFIGSGKLGMPGNALLGFALGCDMVNVGREAMMSVGCIQAQRCHTGRCPTGVATQSNWLTRGLDPELKSVRAASYLQGLRYELARLSRACGVLHPAQVSLDQLELLERGIYTSPARQFFGYEPGWGLPSAADQQALEALMER
jgi:glutamate synthase domain-containing protein 2